MYSGEDGGFVFEGGGEVKLNTNQSKKAKNIMG